MNATPTIPQMLSRMNDAHVKILTAYSEGRHYATVHTRDSALRGFRTASATLSRWGCIIEEMGPGNWRTAEVKRALTERGAALLAAHRDKARA